MQNPPKFSLEMFSNAVFSEKYKIGGNQDLNGWQFQLKGMLNPKDASPAITFTVTLDAAAREITIFADQALVAGLFTGANAEAMRLSLTADLLCKPGTEYAVRLASFDLEAKVGSGSWT